MAYFDTRDHIPEQSAEELRRLLDLSPDINPGAGLFAHKNKYNNPLQPHEIKKTKVPYQGAMLNPMFENRIGEPRQLLFKSKTRAEKKEEIK